jgi:hypothetical protein
VKLGKFLGRLFDNPKEVVCGIICFVAFLVLLFSCEARSEQTLTLEAGSAVLRGTTPTFGFTVGCPGCGPVGTDWEAGFELIGESRFRDREQPNVIQVHAQLVDGWRRAELGLGFYYQNVRTDYVCQFGFHLLARYRVSQRIAVQWRQSSSGGSCEPNTGRDLVSLSVRFGK